MTIKDGFQQKIEAEPRLESIATIQAAIENAAENKLDMQRLFQLNMAVEELITNIVRHGGASEPISVVIRKDPGEFSIELSDQGIPFDPFTQAPKPDLEATLTDRPIGGLGIHLVRKMLDRVAYRREGGRNVVTLAVKLQSSSGNES